jgi:hypothetical protein
MSDHESPKDGSTCASCWDDLSSGNYVEYRGEAAGPWLSSGFCQGCIEVLLKNQWAKYDESFRASTCKAEQRRLLLRGPPVRLSDKTALPCPGQGDHAEVHVLWFMSDGQEHSAKLEGSLEGEARQAYWDEMKSFHIKDEADDPEAPPAATL